ncbi:MAG: hypothetical protein ACKO85_04860, partial [Isosphaeraceae bacterium]
MSLAKRRFLALTMLLLGLSVMLKLARTPKSVLPLPVVASADSFSIAKQDLIKRYENNQFEGELIRRVLEKYAQTAVNLEKTDGLRGLKLLDTLDLEAVYLYENHPREFRRLCELVD